VTERSEKAAASVYPHVVAWLNHIIQQRRPRRVLEQGAGSGQYADLFAPDVYVSIDVPETWYAMRRLPSAYASAAALPFADSAFDLLFSVAAFDYFPDPQRVVHEAARVLRPSGICMVFTYDRATQERIHANCQALPSGRAVDGHHVFDRRGLSVFAAAAGMRCTEMPLLPDQNIMTSVRNWISPSYHRVYRMEHGA
jgi:SAM-dependent methyltransferase